MLPDRYTVSTPRRVYIVTDDLQTRWQMIVAGRVLTDASGLPPSTYQVSVDNPEVYVKIASEGYFALAARPERTFPDLATTGYVLAVSVQAPRHLPAVLSVNLPAGSILPLPPLEIRLAYEPVRLQGRVVLAVDSSPVGAAPISLQIPNTLVLRTPLHFEHLAGTTVNACTFSPVGAARSLTQPAVYLSDRLHLSTATGLGANHILRLGHNHQWEYVVVDGPGTQPNELRLRGGLRRSYPAQTAVQQVNNSFPAGSSSLAALAPVGTGLLPLSGALVGSHVQIQDADPTHVEFHTLGVLSSSQPDDLGYYRLDGIQGVLSFDVHAQNPAGTHTADAGVRVNPMRPVHTLNLRLSAP